MISSPASSRSLSLAPKQKRAVLWMITALLGIILMIAIGIVPGVQRLLEARKTIEETKTVLNELSTKAKTLVGMDEQSIDDQIRIATTALPLMMPYRQSLAALFELFTTYHLGISNLKFSTANRSGKQLLDIAVTISGDYVSVRSFVSDLNHAVPLMSMNSMKLQKKVSIVSSEESLNPYTVELSLLVHQNPAPKTIGKPSDPLPKLPADIQKTFLTLQDFRSFGLVAPASTEPVVPATSLFTP